MGTSFKYELNEELNILFKYYYGLISVEDILASWKYAFNSDLINSNIKGFIIDFRAANYNFQVDRLNEISNFYQEYIHFFKGTKVALITTNPADSVIPVLFKTKDNGYVSHPFSTVQAATNWILS